MDARMSLGADPGGVWSCQSTQKHCQNSTHAPASENETCMTRGFEPRGCMWLGVSHGCHILTSEAAAPPTWERRTHQI